MEKIVTYETSKWIRNCDLSTRGRLVFVGIGSSYWSARFSEFLWRDYADVGGGKDPISIQSFDFVRIRDLHI